MRKSMSKKLITALAVLLLCGCGGTTPSGSNVTTQTSQTTAETITAPVDTTASATEEKKEETSSAAEVQETEKVADTEAEETPIPDDEELLVDDDKPAFDINAVKGVYKSQVDGTYIEIKDSALWTAYDQNFTETDSGIVGEHSEDIEDTTLWYYALNTFDGEIKYTFLNDGSSKVMQFDAGNGGVDLWDRTDDVILKPVVDGDKYLGNFYEEIAGRGYMTISKEGDIYKIQCNWGSSAFESACWMIDATYEDSTGDLVYDNGNFQVLTFSEEDLGGTVTEERSVSGRLHMADTNDKLEWTDNAYEGDPSVFIKE